jgi:serine/threonine-protein kinase
LNAPTVADRKLEPAAPALPPPTRRSRRAGLTSTGTTERTPERKAGFLPFLAAILMAAALLAVVAWEVKVPWLGGNKSSEQPAAQADQPKPQPPAPAPPAPVPVAAPAAAETKPSPMPAGGTAAQPPAEAANQPPAAGNPAPAETKPSAPAVPPQPAAKVPAQAPKIAARGDAGVRRPPPVRIPASPQPVQVVSSPSGAIATMDGQADTACTTPCTLEASPGRHTVELRKNGFDLERREVEVTSGALELPAIVLRSVQGTLMLTSDPPGATVLINGKRSPQATPAQIRLAPGSYSITVEWKDGKQATRTVQIKDGINYQKFLVGQ